MSRATHFTIFVCAALSAIVPTGAQAAEATIQAYKRDPIPIYDNSGSKLREVKQATLPKAKTPAARVISSKPGFVAIVIDGKPSWLRLTTVDYVGDLPAPKCEKVSMQLAMMEEDSVEKSLGLGCDAPKGKKK
jgi:hypothetical protein